MSQNLEILFIEDNVNDAGLIWHQLEKEGMSFQRKIIDNGDDLGKELKISFPDVIISGYILTKLNGMEALKIRNELAPSVPFIVVTGSLNETLAVEAMKAGADDYILKENLSRLGESVRAAIRRKEITQQKEVAERELIKAKEKAEQSDQLKTAFLHNISHEIRTPMNAIVGFAALLNEPGLNRETQQQYLKIITDSSDQLLAIVNDIIEISNIEVGILKMNLNEINLNEQLLMIYQQMHHKAVEKGIGFRLRTSLSGNAAMIETDSTKLIEILTNLLSNAFKFTMSGRIEFGYRMMPGDLMEFFVSDTGIGIREDQYGKIFERFYQVENSASRGYEGTGLGLPISKAYVEFLGGRIWVSSQPGEGSVFYFTLPYRSTVKQHISEMETTEKNKRTGNPKKSILIAEDDDNNFFLMKELLSDLDLSIIRASNGVEAVNAFGSGQQIDLVLMDIKMPVMDGYEATRKILEKQPEARILAQTAYADDEVKAIESGCMGFISKPFVKDRFVSMVKEYL